MIIKSIYAENFRRYKTLSIENIPEKGVITVDGNNEAGKSSISDALCFSLFGRTFLIDYDNTHKLVNWDAEYCATTIHFRKAGSDYSLTRTCDKQGLVAAQLLDADDNIIADEIKMVDDKLHNILGYGYDTFADSFYLMQRELTTPNSASIKDMIGINQYADLVDEFEESTKKSRKEKNSVRPRFEALFRDIEDIELDETWLPELIEARESLDLLSSDKQQYSRLLDQVMDDYPADQPQYQQTLSRYNLFNTLTDILLPLTVIVWVLWAALEFLPKLSVQMLSGQLLPYKDILFNSGVAVVLIYSVSLFYSWWLDGKVIAPLKKKASETQRVLNGTLHHVNQSSEDIPERINSMLISIADTPSLLPVSSLDESKDKSLIKNISQYACRTDKALTALSNLQHDLSFQRNNLSDHQDVLKDAIQAEMARTDEAGTLRQERNRIKKNIEALSRDIKVNNQACDLLKRSSVKFSSQFNKVITQSTSNILPKFTHGNYSKIEIDDNINVRIYSKENAGFIDFEEVSTGTQRQIMLSLRFAMSEQLAINKDNRQQFILLDEPFAFFDHDRTIETLRALPTVSEVVSQIWVFSQEFPSDIKVAKSIHCLDGSSQLLA